MADDRFVRLGARLGDELQGSTGPPPDLARLGSRRARRRTGTLAAAAVVLVVVAVVAVPQLLGGLDGPTIDPVAPSEDPTTPDEPGDGVQVHDLELDSDVPVRLLAVRFNNPSLATFDLDIGQAAVYPPGSHGLTGDAISGALVADDGTIVVWQDDTVRVFPDRLDEPSLAYTSERMLDTPGAAPALRVLPTGDSRALWVVQVGPCCPDAIDGLAELVDLQTGQVRTSVELPPQTFPVALLGDDLLLNTEVFRPGGDPDGGWVADPDSWRTLRLTPDGQLHELTDGHALATAGPTVLIRTCPTQATAAGCRLDLLDTATGQRRPVEAYDDATLDTAAGPAVPGDFTPWNVVAPDGRILITLATHDMPDSEPNSTRLAVLDPDTGAIAEIARYNGAAPPAAWDRQGRHIILADDRDLTIIDPTTGTTITLDGAVPDDHHVVGTG